MNRRIAVICLALTMTGCGILRRVPNQFYSLDTIAGTTPAATTMSGTPIGIDAIELPPGLDRRGIVVRGADHKDEVRGTHQWSSPLEDMVVHTISFNLANRLPEGMVVLPGQAKPAAMRSMSIVFEELAPGPEPQFVLDARWTLTETGTPEMTRHERITIPMTSMESPAVVTAMNQALAELATRITAHVR